MEIPAKPSESVGAGSSRRPPSVSLALSWLGPSAHVHVADSELGAVDKTPPAELSCCPVRVTANSQSARGIDERVCGTVWRPSRRGSEMRSLNRTRMAREVLVPLQRLLAAATLTTVASMTIPAGARGQGLIGGANDVAIPAQGIAVAAPPDGSSDWQSIRPLPLAQVVPPPPELAGENGSPTVPINAEKIDIGDVDPLSYHARGARLPEGRRPQIDGRMSDEVWQFAPAFGNFVQTEPDVGAPATQPTEFRVLFDDRAVYIGFWMWDREPRGIRASELKRDALLRKGDQIKVVVDPFNDRRNVFYFSTNPLGAYKDATGADNGRVQNFDWNANWLVASSQGRSWLVHRDRSTAEPDTVPGKRGGGAVGPAGLPHADSQKREQLLDAVSPRIRPARRLAHFGGWLSAPDGRLARPAAPRNHALRRAGRVPKLCRGHAHRSGEPVRHRPARQHHADDHGRPHLQD